MIGNQSVTVKAETSRLMHQGSSFLNLLLHFLPFMMLFFFIFFSDNLSAQQHKDTTEILVRPKVGVVLSGGGAKGFAHIGALKVIEEAGLPIDYIAGTSMGSIVGGLYAIGYDLDTLINLVKRQDWDAVMSDKIPRRYIPIDDKVMDRNYLATFPFRNKKLQMQSALYDGELINLLLARLTSPAYMIHDYEDLEIPFICVATDMETAEAYEMDKGILQRSIRASMSIPFYFAPVVVDDRLLVDGGLRNNFPVHNLRERDIDILIGIDVQRDFYKKEEMNSMTELLDQLIAMSDIDANQIARQEVDYHIRPDLKGFGMMDFNSFDSIIDAGEKAAREFLPQFQRLADSIKSIQDYEIVRSNVIPLDSVYVVDVIIEGVSEQNVNFIKKSFPKSIPVYMTLEEIEKSIMRVYATGYFNDIWYDMNERPVGVALKIYCEEKEEENVSIAAHYDTDYGIGILANLTMKNIFKKHRRATIEVDLNIAEAPYFKTRFYSNVSQSFKYGAELSVISLYMNQYYKDIINNSYSVQDNRLDMYMTIMPDLDQQLRLGAVMNYVHLRDRLINVVDSDSYDFVSFAYFNYHLNNEDSPTFASKGWKLNINGKYIMPVIKLQDGTRMKNSFVLRTDLDFSFALGKKHSLKIGSTVGAKFGKNDIPLSYQFFVGGQSKMNYFDNIISFEGMRFTQVHGDYMSIAKLSWQYNFYNNLYAIATVNGGFLSDNYDKWFSPDNFSLGCGLTLGMETIAGPIEISLMGSNYTSGLIGFINVGYWF